MPWTVTTNVPGPSSTNSMRAGLSVLAASNSAEVGVTRASRSSMGGPSPSHVL
jgi:hypothetical protein